MAKARLSLAAAPRFKAKVGIPIPGGTTDPVEFIFKHRTKKQIAEWREGIDLETDGVTTEVIMSIAEGWDLDDPFSAESVEQMLEQYPGSGVAIYVKYLQELQDAKLGNFVR